MLLEQLPVDIFREILKESSSFLVIRLWQCGNARLNYTLANHGIEEVILADTARYSPSKWPRMLKNLKLLSLYVESASALGSIDMVRNQVYMQHNGLCKLVLRAIASVSIIFGLEMDLGPTSNKRAKLSEHQQCSDTIGPKFNLSSSFPSLQTLEIDDYAHYQNYLAREHWLTLPRSLTSLKMNFGNIEELVGLPEGLTLLSMPILTLTEKVLKTLPSSLVELYGDIRADALDYLLSEDGLRRLPNLDPFFFPSFCYDLDLFHRISEIGWPSTTRELICLEIDPTNLDKKLNFPASLTSLFFSVSRNVIGHSHHLFILPDTLIRLNVSFIDWEMLEAQTLSSNSKSSSSLLPKHLLHLTLHKDRNFSPRYFRWLPRSLTYLNVTSPSTASSIADPLLHEEVSSHAISILHSLDLEKWSELKKEAQQSPHRFSASNMKEIENGAHYGLPLTLKSVVLSMAAPSSIVMPPLVTSACIPCHDNLSSSITALPTSLTSLEWIYYFADDEPTKSELHALDLDNERFWMELQTMTPLTSLDCYMPSNALKYLPRSLYSLRVCLIGRISSKNVSDLPHHLKRLTLFGTLLRDRFIALLPRELEYLNISENSLDSSNLKDLPRTLRFLHVNTFHNLESHHLHQLPATLKEIQGGFSYMPKRRGKSRPTFFHPAVADFGAWNHILSLVPLFPRDKSLTEEQFQELILIREDARNNNFWSDIDPRTIRAYSPAVPQ